jgi:2-haloacid dehalogenase
MTDRWATFDCYGTLIDWESGIAYTLLELWPDLEREQLLELHSHFETQIEAEGSPPYREVLDRTTAAIAKHLGREIPAYREHALSESLPRWQVFPEVPGAMAELRAAGWKIGILSNVDPDLLKTSLPRLGVPVDVTITVAEAGSYKPAFGHWKAFFEQSGADRARHVHVAASLFHDIAPAAAQDLRSVWINRKGQVSEIPRTAELATLEGLATTLERIVPA